MYLITNRAIRESRKGFKKFGDKPNPEGPHELRLASVSKTQTGFRVKILPDELTSQEKSQLGLPVADTAYASQMVARTVFNRIRRSKKNLLLFVHGYNNNVEAVVQRAFRLQQRFDVEVLPFSWPANGGGALDALDYKSDKKDARASIGALDRVLEKIRKYMQDLRADELQRIRAGTRSLAHDAETRDERLARRLEQNCPFRVNLMLHSMGNYLFKQLLKSSLYGADELLFDNVIMVAADANNKDHSQWVDRIKFRNRLYVTINENDSALRLSRMKGGSEQLARLGHFPYELDSSRAVYVNFTDAPHVKDSHAYFEKSSLRNARVDNFFDKAINGRVAESSMKYDSSRNLYNLRGS